MKQISSLYSLDFNFVKLVLYVTVSLKHLPQWQLLPVHDQLIELLVRVKELKLNELHYFDYSVSIIYLCCNILFAGFSGRLVATHYTAKPHTTGIWVILYWYFWYTVKCLLIGFYNIWLNNSQNECNHCWNRNLFLKAVNVLHTPSYINEKQTNKNNNKINISLCRFNENAQRSGIW